VPVVRRCLLIITLIVLLVLLVGLPITGAQDPTPTPKAPEVVGMPFSDTFDTNWGWTSSGDWTFDTITAYDGGGWRLDGSARNQTSTLEYNSLINLSGTQNTQLLFRQKGTVPSSDLIAVDVSLDGGISWMTVDQQIGLDQPEWALHVADLTGYRGQIIRLRFRLSTGATMNDEDDILPELSIDNLSLQYLLIPPDVALGFEDTGPHTLLGLHLVVGAERETVVEFANRLRYAGRPLGSLKGTSGTEEILNEVAIASPETVIIYRALDNLWGRADCPNEGNDPTIEAQRWFTGLLGEWLQVNADYYELMNECLINPGWLVPFAIESMRLANEQGVCLLLFSFPPGHPDPGMYSQLLPVYQYAMQNPCRSGRLHGIALHEYGYEPTRLVSESGTQFGFRHQILSAEILSRQPDAVYVPVYITEAGPGDGRTEFSCEDVTRDALQYSYLLEQDRYVRGFDLWNIGQQGDWVDFSACLPMIGDALISYYGGG
jgi:hypothetical protein